jgi:hypothetical protein
MAQGHARCMPNEHRRHALFSSFERPLPFAASWTKQSARVLVRQFQLRTTGVAKGGGIEGHAKQPKVRGEVPAFFVQPRVLKPNKVGRANGSLDASNRNTWSMALCHPTLALENAIAFAGPNVMNAQKIGLAGPGRRSERHSLRCAAKG